MKHVRKSPETTEELPGRTSPPIRCDLNHRIAKIMRLLCVLHFLQMRLQRQDLEAAIHSFCYFAFFRVFLGAFAGSCLLTCLAGLF